mmetsp:Transcript_17954/g.51426  ORF Transcript_17954/g.51426 Transcript_17954/m.51426 type:complete len:225 (-) Transcript_17954:53-727(-)|eukprot:CAMPEP_0181046266 /NCGR_PEP_ID=MMETSP1070-20121207/14254_1 /TAXON_ID=265543 /ORGANISM="Minutocellus polymorphus, Strain NH13" /LENGTH=224 /DNA_ID=CAMNT_0023124859 /DNA_START=81 /DNA_END=755 /DNA_ORIENTATION=-
MIASHSSSNEVLVRLKDHGGGSATANVAIVRPPMLAIPPSQSCVSISSAPGIMDSMHSNSISPACCSSANSLMELLGKSQQHIGQFSQNRNTDEVDRHIVMFDEVKITKRIEKDIKRGRLTRARSSDSFLEGKVEMSRRKMRSYLSFGHESGAAIDKLSRQPQDHDHTRTRSSFHTLGESAKIAEALMKGKNKNEMFDQMCHQDEGRLRRASAATSAGRALLSR